jgi:hypothetical protein
MVDIQSLFFFFSFNGLGIVAYPDSEFISENVNLLDILKDIGPSQSLYGSAYTGQYRHRKNAAILDASSKIRTHDLTVRAVVDYAP